MSKELFEFVHESLSSVNTEISQQRNDLTELRNEFYDFRNGTNVRRTEVDAELSENRHEILNVQQSVVSSNAEFHGSLFDISRGLSAQIQLLMNESRRCQIEMERFEKLSIVRAQNSNRFHSSDLISWPVENEELPETIGGLRECRRPDLYRVATQLSIPHENLNARETLLAIEQYLGIPVSGRVH